MLVYTPTHKCPIQAPAVYGGGVRIMPTFLGRPAAFGVVVCPTLNGT